MPITVAEGCAGCHACEKFGRYNRIDMRFDTAKEVVMGVYTMDR